MSSAAPSATRNVFEALLLAAAFSVAHTQGPLYYSNQNQYLLHGAALAHHGYLANDWLANTRDPTPIFSSLVAAVFAVDPWILQPAYFVLLMGYFLAARCLVAAIPNMPATRPARLTFAALFTAAHAGILRWASVEMTGIDYPWYAQAGVAAQYLLGPGLQPSAFGVLLLAAVAAIAHGRPLLASALAASTCLFHSTYLLPAVLLLGGIAAELARARRYARASAAVAIALVILAPVVAFTVRQFEPFGPRAEAALLLLTEVRIPHHCDVTRWFDLVAALQVVWMTIGLLLLRRTPLAGAALGNAAALAAGLTMIQIATQSPALALMFPWRLSVLLVPVATIAVFAAGLSRVNPGAWGGRAATAAILALAAGGVAVNLYGLGYRGVEEEQGLMDHVKATARPDDVYLLPVQIPAVGTGRGAVSNTFTKPARDREGTNQIPVDLQRFRLVTGACIYVDFKSVPYAPPEVLEWYRRMTFATDLAARGSWDAPNKHAELIGERITHVVWPRTKPLAIRYLTEEYRDKAYIVYRVKRAD
jgi:hypothetical protein